MSATAERLSVYRLMDDRTLTLAVADLEAKLAQFAFARGPVAGRMREAFEDALLAARAEMERRAI